MPPPDEEKTEDPTPKRKQDFREKGQVMRSSDFTAAMVLMAGVLLLNFMGPHIFEGFYNTFHLTYSHLYEWDIKYLPLFNVRWCLIGQAVTTALALINRINNCVVGIVHHIEGRARMAFLPAWFTFTPWPQTFRRRLVETIR